MCVCRSRIHEPPHQTIFGSEARIELDMSSKNEEVPKEQEQKAQLLDGRLYGLPEGWLVEQRRRTNPRYEGKVDQVN